MILSIKESELIFVSSILSQYETESRYFELLRIFDKLYKCTSKRLLKKTIRENIEDFKKLNRIRDLNVYKKGADK